MKKVALVLLSMVLSNFALADGYEHGNEFPFKYFLHNDITTDDAQATLAGTRAFVASGVFKGRGVAVGVYAYNAGGGLGSRLSPKRHAKRAATACFRLIGIDRPANGESSALAGRSIADWT